MLCGIIIMDTHIFFSCEELCVFVLKTQGVKNAITYLSAYHPLYHNDVACYSVKEHHGLILVAVIAAGVTWYVIHKSCSSCQSKWSAMKNAVGIGT